MAKRTYTHWTNEDLFAAAKKHKTRGAFYEKDPSAYMACKRKGIFEKACEHMEPADRHKFQWTLPMIKAEAKKYQTRGEFSKGCRPAYSAAARRGLLDEICAHMPKYARKKKTKDPAKSLNELMGLTDVR